MGRKRQYASAAARQRSKRARDRAGRVYRLDSPRQPVVAVVDASDPVGALAEWSRKKADRPAWPPAKRRTARAAGVRGRLAQGDVERARIRAQ